MTNAKEMIKLAEIAYEELYAKSPNKESKEWVDFFKGFCEGYWVNNS